MKKIIALLLACMLILSLAACGGGGTPVDTKPSDSDEKPSDSDEPAPSGEDKPSGEDSEAPPADGTASVKPLNIAVSEDHGTMLPQAASGTGGMVSVIRTIYEPLYYQRADGSFEYCLASSMDTIDENHYTIHLREGVVFSNGNPFTSADVMFTMELYHGHPRHGMMVGNIDFEKTKAIDDYTVDLWLTEYSLIQLPALAAMYIHDEESYNEEDLALNPVTTGPYEVTDYVVNSHIYLKARPDYWGEQPPIPEIRFTFMTEDAQRVNAITIGEADVAKIPMKDVEYVESLDDYSVKIAYGPMADCAYINVTPGGPFGTNEARQAFMMAIDRQAIIDVVYGGRSTAPRWPVSEYCTDFDEAKYANMDEVYATGYNPEKAKELAEQSGLVGKTLRIAVNGQADYVTMAEMIKYDLEQIGVNSEILSFDQATYFSALMDESNFDIGIYLISDTIGSAVDFFANYPLFFPLGWSGTERDEFVALGLKGLGTADEAARDEILYELATRFEKANIWFPISEFPNVSAISKHLGGMEYYLDGNTSYCNWYWID